MGKGTWCRRLPGGDVVGGRRLSRPSNEEGRPAETPESAATRWGRRASAPPSRVHVRRAGLPVFRREGPTKWTMASCTNHRVSRRVSVSVADAMGRRATPRVELTKP